MLSKSFWIKMKTPEEIIDHFCIEHPEEIDIEAICFHYNAKVEKHPLSGCEGRLIGYKDKAVITVNSKSSLNRQRFTVGHELCHWLNDRGDVAHKCTEEIIMNSWFKDNPETRANKFSARLLMPDQLMRKFGRNKKFKLREMKELAGLFRVSVTAMAIRFLKLDLASGMLVWSDGKERKRFTVNPSYPKRAWPVQRVDNESCAAFIKEKDQGSQYGCEMPADVWIDDVKASHFNLYEDSMVILPGTVLSLISWPDEEFLIQVSDN